MRSSLPKPEDNQVLVRLQGCGICDSNLSVWKGGPGSCIPEAGAPGHEGWGIVEAVGAAVTDIDVGQRVAMLSGHAYAEFDIAPRDRVIPLPDELDDEPFPADSFGRAMSIFQRSGIRSGHSVAIVGDGLVELLLAQLAADAGASRGDARGSRRRFAARRIDGRRSDARDCTRRTGSAAGDGAGALDEDSIA